MRNFILTVIAAVLAVGCAPKSDAVLVFNVENPTAREVVVVCHNAIHTAALDENGSAELVMTGIDAAKILREHNLNTLLIFLTTSQDHMVQAFPCHAFDYLFKPFEEKRLYKTLNEALKVLPENSPYLDIVCDKHTHSVFLSEILYILSDSNYCIVGLKDKEYRTRASFSDFTSKVKDAPEFFTISRGIMVNLDNVISIDKTDCTLINQEVFPVSRRKHEEAEKALLERRFEKRRKGGSI